MKVIIDGEEYLLAREVLANRDAIIRGLLSEFWGELGKTYNEKEKCDGITVFVNDLGEGIPLLDIVNKIANYAIKQ
jgi:hypothetical protein